jgi:hypothetical protein
MTHFGYLKPAWWLRVSCGKHYQRTHLIKAVAKHCNGLVAAQTHERGQQLQLLVCADADALPPDGVHLVLRQQTFNVDRCSLARLLADIRCRMLHEEAVAQAARDMIPVIRPLVPQQCCWATVASC